MLQVFRARIHCYVVLLHWKSKCMSVENKLQHDLNKNCVKANKHICNRSS